MIYILHIDTSADTCTIALAGDGQLLAKRTTNENRNFASLINGMIDEVLAEAGIAMKDLAAVANCGGPGSYTGLRIGLSTAKAICYTLDKPLIQHDKLFLLGLRPYYKYLLKYDNYLILIPARANEYFISLYDNKLATVLQPQHIFKEGMAEIIDKYGKSLLVAGVLNDESDLVINEEVHFNPETDIDTELWAKHTFLDYNNKKFENIAHAEPIYLKQVYTHK